MRLEDQHPCESPQQLGDSLSKQGLQLVFWLQPREDPFQMSLPVFLALQSDHRRERTHPMLHSVEPGYSLPLPCLGPAAASSRHSPSTLPCFDPFTLLPVSTISNRVVSLEALKPKNCRANFLAM